VEGGPFVQSLAIVHARNQRRNHHPTNHTTTTLPPNEIKLCETVQRTSVKIISHSETANSKKQNCEMGRVIAHDPQKSVHLLSPRWKLADYICRPYTPLKAGQ
jgi:hypothetical protein